MIEALVPLHVKLYAFLGFVYSRRDSCVDVDITLGLRVYNGYITLINHFPVLYQYV